MNSARRFFVTLSIGLLSSNPILGGGFSESITQNEIHFTEFQTDELHQEPIASPDGKLVAYIHVEDRDHGKRRLWVMDRDGGDARRLIGDPRPHQQAYPKWSPDNQYIAFSSNLGGETSIWIVHVEQGKLTKITDRHLGDVFFVNAAWSPDSRSLVANMTGAETDQLLEYPIAGGKPDTLLETREIVFPTWSPDGRQIVFCGSTHENGNLWTFSVSDKSVVPLDSGGIIGFYLSWSPNGEWLAFQADPGPHIYVMPAKGGQPLQVTDRSLVSGARTVAWDYDGKSLLYSGHPRGSAGMQPHLAIVDTTGENFQILANLSGEEGLSMITLWGQQPSWSPDERFIAFTSFDEDTTIAIVETERRTIRKLTKGRGQFFSPGGTEIAFLHEGALWTTDLDEIDPYPITLALPGSPMFPEWSPDDEWIVFRNRETLWKVSPYGGEPTLLLEDDRFAVGVGFTNNSQSYHYFSRRNEGTEDTPGSGFGGVWRANIVDGSSEYVTQNVGWFTDISHDSSFLTAGGLSATFGLKIHRLTDGTSKTIRFDETPRHQVVSTSISPSGTRVAFYLVSELFLATWRADVSNLVSRAMNLP